MNLFDKFKDSEFIKNLIPLFFGTSSAQFILLISSPILTRIFSPESFGILTIYYSILSILGVVGSLRYELAIMLPEKMEDSRSIFFLSIFISIFVSLIILLFLVTIFLISDWTSVDYLFFLVPGLLLTSFFQILTNWNNRFSNFKLIASANVAQTSVTSFSQITLGMFGFSSYGLIFGSLLGLASAILVFLKSNIFNVKLFFRHIKTQHLIHNLKEYKEFPYFSLPGALVSSISLQAPVLFVSFFFGQAITGFYGLALRVVYLPIVLLSTPIFQVTYKKISDLDIHNPSNIRAYVLKKVFYLAVVAIPLPIFFFFFSEEVFAFIFGEDWRRAGDFAVYLSFLAYFKFCVSPAMSVFNLKRNVRAGAIWQFSYFITLSITLYLLYSFSFSIETLLISIVIHEFLQSVILILLTYLKTSS